MIGIACIELNAMTSNQVKLSNSSELKRRKLTRIVVDHCQGDLVAPECRPFCLPRVVLAGGGGGGAGLLI